jgi:hypothetical protein
VRAKGDWSSALVVLIGAAWGEWLVASVMAVPQAGKDQTTTAARMAQFPPPAAAAPARRRYPEHNRVHYDPI